MSLEGITIHNVRRMELSEPKKLSTGTYARNLTIATDQGTVIIALFSPNSGGLNVVRK
jgi:hypothetical protein